MREIDRRKEIGDCPSPLTSHLSTLAPLPGGRRWILEPQVRSRAAGRSRRRHPARRRNHQLSAHIEPLGIFSHQPEQHFPALGCFQLPLPPHRLRPRRMFLAICNLPGTPAAGAAHPTSVVLRKTLLRVFRRPDVEPSRPLASQHVHVARHIGLVGAGGLSSRRRDPAKRENHGPSGPVVTL